jgi:hypothetical protein
VPNLPFTADVVTRFERTLDNGQSVIRETHSRVMRDSQGRVRIETTLPNSDKVERITIQDPAQNQVITLDARTSTATVLHLADGTSAQTPGSSASTNSVILAQNGTGGSSAIPMGGRHVSSPVVSGDTIGSNRLGTKTMDGVQVVGIRTIRTPARRNGIELSQSISDSWYSTELKLTLASESHDPSGRSSMRVTNLVRSEPAPQLFQIPADYTIKSVGQGAVGSQP